MKVKGKKNEQFYPLFACTQKTNLAKSIKFGIAVCTLKSCLVSLKGYIKALRDSDQPCESTGNQSCTARKANLPPLCIRAANSNSG
jgi:hypothetical protein